MIVSKRLATTRLLNGLFLQRFLKLPLGGHAELDLWLIE
jgi:hypothetical protein